MTTNTGEAMPDAVTRNALDLDFEDGTYAPALIDVTIQGPGPTVTERFAASGEHSLLLRSERGEFSRNKVLSSAVFRGPTTYRTAMRWIDVRSSRNNINFGIQAPAESRGLCQLDFSEYHRGVKFKVRPDAASEKRVQYIEPGFPRDEWFDVALTTTPDGTVRVAIAGEKFTFSPAGDWHERPVRLKLAVNEWADGSPAAVAYDTVQVRPLGQ